MKNNDSLSTRWYVLSLLLAFVMCVQACQGGGTSGTGVVTSDAAGTYLEGTTPICGKALDHDGVGREQLLVETENGESVMTDADGGFVLSVETGENGVVIVLHDDTGPPERLVVDEWAPEKSVVLLTRGGQVALFQCGNEELS